MVSIGCWRMTGVALSEMEEVAVTPNALGAEAAITPGTIRRQRAFGSPGPISLDRLVTELAAL